MSKPYWIILLALTGGLALWVGGSATFSLWRYNQISSEVPAQIAKTEVIPVKSKYALRVTYSYSFGGKKYHRAQILPKPYYLNRNSADRARLARSGMISSAWIDAKSPQISSLERELPLRLLVYGIAVLGVFLYFLYLRVHLELLQRSM